MRTYVYVDASNLFYGGRKSLGWSIDYEKLLEYLKERYDASRVYYFGGVETHRFPFDYLKHDTVPLSELEDYLNEFIKSNKHLMTEAKLILIDRHLKRVKFYRKLEKFGYQLVLKPVKSYEDEEGNVKRKANCDVEMSYRLMKDQDEFERVLILSGDGDFLPVLKHLRNKRKEVHVMARGPRTAKEIRQFAGSLLLDFEYLREILRREE